MNESKLPRAKNLNLLFAEVKNDDRLFCVSYSGSRVQEQITYKTYVDQLKKLAALLYEEYHIRPGDRVMVVPFNDHFTLIVYGALIHLSAVIVPVNPEENDEFADFVRNDAGCRLCISVAKALQAWQGAVDIKFVEMQSLVRQAMTSICQLPDIDRDNELALLIYTSGTTGRSKGVMLTQKNILANASAVSALHEMNKDTVQLCVLPLFHVNAFNLSFVASLYSGSTLILSKRFYLPSFWQIIAAEKVMFVPVAPLIVQQLVDDPREVTGLPIPKTLRYLISAAAPLSNKLLNAFLTKFPNIRLLQGYGLSESVNFSLTVPPLLDSETYKKVMLDEDRPSAGIPLPGCDIEAMDSNGHVLAEKQTGELVIRSDSNMLGYLNGAEINSEVYKWGWLHTGDLCWWQIIDDQRFFYLCGRLKETVKRKGETVSLLEIDESLSHYSDQYGQMIAVGFENDYAGEEIGLYVIPEAESSLADVDYLELCQKLFPRYRMPRAIVFGEHIPRTATGKIQRNKLAYNFESFKVVNLENKKN